MINEIDRFVYLLQAGYTIEEAVAIVDGQTPAIDNHDQAQAKLNNEDWWNETDHQA